MPGVFQQIPEAGGGKFRFLVIVPRQPLVEGLPEPLVGWGGHEPRFHEPFAERRDDPLVR